MTLWRTLTLLIHYLVQVSRAEDTYEYLGVQYLDLLKQTKKGGNALKGGKEKIERKI